MKQVSRWASESQRHIRAGSSDREMWWTITKSGWCLHTTTIIPHRSDPRGPMAHQSVGGTIHAVSRYASTNPQRDIPLTPSQPVPQSSRLEISQILSGAKWRLWCLFTHPGMAYCPNQHLQTSSLTLAVLKTSRCNGIEMVWVCRRISKKFEVARSRVVRLWAVSRPQLIASTLIQPLLDLTQNRRLQSFMLWSVWKTT